MALLCRSLAAAASRLQVVRTDLQAFAIADALFKATRRERLTMLGKVVGIGAAIA